MIETSKKQIYVTVESVHRSRHVNQKSEAFRFLLRGSGLGLVFTPFLVDGLFAGYAFDQLRVVKFTYAKRSNLL